MTSMTSETDQNSSKQYLGIPRRDILMLGSLTLGGLAWMGISNLFKDREPGMTVQELETYASQTQQEYLAHNQLFLPRRELCRSTPLKEMSMVHNMNYQAYVEHMMGYLRDAEKLSGDFMVADVGGSYGTAVQTLNQMDGVQSFCIDPVFHAQDEENPISENLPNNRMIVKGIEDSGVQDQTFHLVTSHNATQYIDLTLGLPEMYRICKPLGSVIYELECWVPHENDRFKQLAALKGADLSNAVTYVNLGLGAMMNRLLSLEEFFKFVDKVLSSEETRELAELVMPTVKSLKLPEQQEYSNKETREAYSEAFKFILRMNSTFSTAELEFQRFKHLCMNHTKQLDSMMAQRKLRRSGIGLA